MKFFSDTAFSRARRKSLNMAASISLKRPLRLKSGPSETFLTPGLGGAGASVVGMHVGKRFALELNLYPVHKLRLKK